MASFLTISFYTAAWAFMLNSLLRGRNIASKVLPIIAAGIVVHAVAVYISVFSEQGLQLDFFRVASLFFFVINLIVLISSLRQPLVNLFVFLMPLSILGVLVSELFDSPLSAQSFGPGMVAHILLSILAYSLLTIASIQALLLAYQSKQLKTKHFHGVMGIMPPLQTMEALLFDLVWAGFIFLSLSIITGVVYLEDILQQKLSHKTVFSILSWMIYAVLLAGHRIYGWRGPSAIRWVLGGFAALMLAYFGSKLVIEIILGYR